jgi:conjugal transfer ATP-binding protein TraC
MLPLVHLAARDQKKICIIDEAWDLMAGGNTGKFIVTGYRRARRYNGCFITVTQKIDDYAENATTAACYSNAAIKIMLMQDPPKLIEVDDYTKRLLSNLKSASGVYSELIIQMEKSTSLCRFIIDELSLLLYSSKAEDSILRDKVREVEGLDTVQGLQRLLQIREAYMHKFNRPSQVVSEELIKYIATNGYDELLRLLELNIFKE